VTTVDTQIVTGLPVHEIAEPLDRALAAKLKIDTLVEIIMEDADAIEAAIDLVCVRERDPNWVKERAARISKIGQMVVDELKSLSQHFDASDRVIAAHSSEQVSA
jgi:hypothetical protein